MATGAVLARFILGAHPGREWLTISPASRTLYFYLQSDEQRRICHRIGSGAGEIVLDLK
jgi:hypothetical protein